MNQMEKPNGTRAQLPPHCGRYGRLPHVLAAASCLDHHNYSCFHHHAFPAAMDFITSSYEPKQTVPSFSCFGQVSCQSREEK